ncbi:MAG: hypothetical protein K8T90_17825 [Planctomycetes bacterium]|nr:hypothetical protein [Planctomycetota bacterium]
MPHPNARLALMALLLVATASGCDNALGNDGPADLPLVRVLADSVVPAASVEIRLTNASAATWGYNTCSSPRLQKREGNAWVDQPDPLILCTADITALGAGVVRTVTYGAPIGLAAGTYRLRYRFVRNDGVVAFALANEFVVR